MMNQDPPLCANGCGFFGNPTTQNLCSKCYNNVLKQKMQNTVELELGPALGRLTLSSLVGDQSSNSSNNDDIITTTTTANNNNDVALDEMDMKKKKTNRCEVCKKRVGLPGFTCKCDGVFCGTHRYPEEHCCNVDCKGYARKVLSNALFAGSVKADKLDYRL